MSRKIKVIIVFINVFVGLLHFVVGPAYKGPFPKFVSGYLIDIVLPTALYLLFILVFRKSFSVRSSRWLSASTVLFIGFSMETLQYFGIYLFGETFDPLDYLMYLMGTLLGVLVDILLQKKIKYQPTP